MADTFQEFTDPRLVLLYDHWSDSRDDVEFYLALADELGPADLVDIGCGTGAVTCELALARPRQERRVSGFDPAPRMLEIARHRPGAERVRWVEGDASRLEGGAFDLAIMTAHVPQVIFEQDAWALALRETYRAVRPGGHLAFESRNPSARAWEAWTPQRSQRLLCGTPLGEVEQWIELLDVDGDLVTYDIHYRLESGEELISHDALRFRSLEEIEAGLAVAGFSMQRVYGDWDRSPARADSPELIVVAGRA